MKTKVDNGERLLFDRANKMYVRVQLSQDKSCYEKWISKNKRKWTLSETYSSIDEVMKAQENLIDSNYRNLFNVITGV